MASKHAGHHMDALASSSADGTLVLRPPVRCNTCGLEEHKDLLSPFEDHSIALEGDSLHEEWTTTKTQLLWDQTMCDVLKIPRGYTNVHVLLIQWEQNDWMKETASEIEALKVVFQNRFNFEVEIYQIPSSSTCSCGGDCVSSQKHLDDAMKSFFDRCGTGDNCLAIVYYTGHGDYEPTLKHLELSGLKSTEDGSRPPSLIWNHTEKHFPTIAHCDILAIMDCCHAAGLSAIVQGIEGRTYEYLVAVEPINAVTNPPGRKSFTTALINALEQLLEDNPSQSFTTFQLQTAIQKQRVRKATVNYGHLVRLKTNPRRISLQPAPHDKTYFKPSNIEAHLHLRVELKQKQLTKAQVEKLSTLISRAVWEFNKDETETVTRRIDFMGLQERKRGKHLFKDGVNRTMSLRKGLQALRRQEILQAVEQQDLNPVLKKPGFWATFGFQSRHFHVYYRTFVLQRPWSWIVITGILCAGAMKLSGRPKSLLAFMRTVRNWFKG